MRQSLSQTLRSFPLRHQLICLVPTVLLLCCLAALIGTGSDIALYFKGSGARHPLVERGLRFVTDWTNIAFYLVYAVLFARGRKSADRSLIRFTLVFAAVQILVCGLLVQLTKIAVGRPRPLLFLDGASCSPFTFKGTFHSFPSGHTSEIAGAALPLADRYARPLLSLLLGLLVALVAFSRIYLSQHHISDVAAGLAVGAFASLLNHHFCHREQP